MDRFSIAKSTLEQMINYLATKPYNEVAQLIAVVQRDIKPIVEEQAAEQPKSED